MSTKLKILSFGWVLIFGIVACSPPGLGEQASGEGETLEAPPSPEEDSVSQEIQQLESNSPALKSDRNYDDLEIITLLPRDGIPAIDNPQFLSASQADEEYAPDELVIGVNFEGDARAYSIPFLSGREILNDTVGGRKIAVTW
jgi:hypothetical protein